MNHKEEGQEGSPGILGMGGPDTEEQLLSRETGRPGRDHPSSPWLWGVALVLIGLVAGIGSTFLGIQWFERFQRHVTVREAVVSGEQVPVTAPMEGKIDSMSVEEGDRVNPGQVIATIDNAGLQEEIRRARAEVRRLEDLLKKTERGLEELRQRVPREVAQTAEALQACRSRVKAAQDRLRLGSGDSRRSEIVYGSGPGRLSQKRQATAELEAARNELKRAEARNQAAMAKKNLLETKTRFAAAAKNRLEKARGALELATKKTDAATIASPVSGFVSQKTRSAGDPVKPGEAVVIIVDLQRLWLDTHIEPKEARRVAPGQSAEIRLDPPRFGSTLKGRVIQVGASQSSPQWPRTDRLTENAGSQGGSKIPVRIELLQTDQQVRPGIKASVVIDTQAG
ncbi:MAG: HlyD family secretion protein [Deltaproteobacteria bacterium]|nr:HlyD family secretion protein [Deltaproteobacteria bacterium]